MAGGYVVYLYLHQTCRQCYILSLWTGTVHCHLDNGLTRHVSRVTNFHSRMWVSAEDFELVRYYTHLSTHPPYHQCSPVHSMNAWESVNTAPLSLHLDIREGCLVTFTSRPLYPRCPLNRRLAGPHSTSRRFGEDENLFSLPGVELKFFGRLARSLVAIPAEISGLPLYNRNADKGSIERRWYVGANVRAQLLFCKRNYFAETYGLNCFEVD